MVESVSMNVFKKLWLRSAFLFEPVQDIFNGDFWKVFVRRFKKYTTGRIVDLGCGTGEFIRLTNPKKYLGIDINRPYIELDTKNYGKKNIAFELGDITKLSPKEKYDTAFLISVAHHLSDFQLGKVCANLKRMRVKNFIICDGYPIWPFKKILMWLDSYLGGGDYFRDEEMVARVASKHFKVIEKGNFRAKSSLYTYPYVVLRSATS